MAYTSDDPSDRLAAVRAAIDRCLTSQEYGTGNRKQVAARLDFLRQLERDLIEEVANTTGGDSMASLAEVAPLL